ncbi:CCR4-NOT transcription complex subunit 1, partial [Choanephora cucurbitarum]
MSKKTANSESLLLSKKLLEEGYHATSTVNDALTAMEQVEVTDESVSRALAMIIRTHAKLQGSAEGQTWQLHHFIQAAYLKNPRLNWFTVLSKLDQAEFMLYDPVGLQLLIQSWQFVHKDEPFPVQIFLQPWMHVRGQFSVLFCMLYASRELLDMNQTNSRKVIPEDVIPALPVSMRQAASQLASQQLNCLGLLEAILNLAGTMVSDDVRALMDRLASQTPELLMIGLAQIQPIKNELHRTFLPKLLNLFLMGHVNSSLVVRLLWHVQPNLLLEGFFEMYKKDPTSVSRILDIAQEAKIVVHILKTDVPFFTLDLASLAARRQNLNLEKWLMERLAKDGFAFFGSCVDFLEKKCAIEMARQSGANVIPNLQLSMDVIRVFFRILSERPLPPAETAKLAKLSQLYTQLYPQLNEQRPDKPAMSESNVEGERTVFSDEVEEMVGLYFERLYTQDISASRFASVLKACRTSNDQRQVNFFSCTMHTLLDEARFFSQYPENELMATGELLGLLIDQHLISFAQLRVTLKLVLDALKYPVGSKMFNFGMQALVQFRNRLYEWPQYTLLLSKIEGLRGYPVIVESIATTLKQLAQKDPDGKLMGLANANSPQQRHASPPPQQQLSEGSNDTVEKSVEAAPNVTTLLKSSSNQSYETPPDKTQERIAFLINNLSASNTKSKSSELKQILQASTWGWFSHYLVVRRVSIEPNNHELYAGLLDELDLQDLTETVIEETYTNIHLLLQSDSIVHSSSDRNLLKNLGTWLGRLTIAKNKPIRHKDLSLKDLLTSSYEKNQLIVAIPLVCKILQHAAYSKIFKPPNPWLMGNLKVLAELYWTEGLKLNLKFEIELLYRGLEMDLNEIEPTSILASLKPAQASQAHQSPLPPPGIAIDRSTIHSPATSQKSSRALPMEEAPPVVVGNNPLAPTPSASNSSLADFDFTPVLSKLQINPAVGQLMMQHPLIKSTVYSGVSEAFADVVPNIIQTSTNIAAVSTKEMILKDFATEPDEIRLRRAAHAMVQPLACSLTVVSAKEPLCSGIISIISSNLIQQGLPELLAEEIATTIANENTELLCMFIDQIAKTKALEDVDRALAPAYASRIAYRKQQQQMQGGGMQPFFDTLSLNGAPHQIQLPDILRPMHGVSPDQFRLYESFDQRS